ncbi:MAG: hypothetical protein U0234_31505 [Sandaracinus sp.]
MRAPRFWLAVAGIVLSSVSAACAPPSTADDAGAGHDASRSLDGAPEHDASAAPEDGAASDDAFASPDTSVASDAGSAGCGTAATTGDLLLTARDGAGVERTYLVHVPASYDGSRPLAILFAYHGAGGDENASRGYGFEAAVGEDAILVYPRGVPFEGFGVGWNDRCSGYDMPFFDAMLAHVSSTYCVDPQRIFVAGFSWGGDYVTALACCRGDVIRAAAPASCSDEFGDHADYRTYANLPCPAVGRPALRFTHATLEDGPYAAPLFATTSELYRSWNACGAGSSATSPAPCVRYDGCAEPVVECAYDGLGHATPSGWATDTWSFFDALP